MNKRMREILAQIQAKTAEAQKYNTGADGVEKDTAKAIALMDEVDALKKEYETEKRIFEAEKMGGVDQGDPHDGSDNGKDKTLTSEQIIGKEIRAIMKPGEYDTKDLSEFRDADGGYTVPEDIQTAVRHWPEVDHSFLADISVENVSTITGSRTYQARGDAQAFYDMDDDGSLSDGQKIESPQFERINYAVKQRGGFMPVPNNLVADSDANISAIVTEWLARANIATCNKKVKAIIAAHNGGVRTDFKGISGIKKAVTVTLGQAYKSGAKIITNDDGLNYLDTLMDANNRPLLNPDPTDSARLTLRCGSVVVPVRVYPNNALESIPVYAKTTDADVVPGKEYFTLSGNKYTIVEKPVKGSISTYYEVKELEIPFIVGDLKQGIRKYDRQSMSLKASDVAVIGNFNAFAQNMTLIRALMRDDYRELDANAYVNGYIKAAV